MGGQRHRNQDNGYGMSGGSTASGHSTQGVTGGAQNALTAHNNMQPGTVLAYLIKIV